MPVFDFNNSPEDQKVPECTYKVFYTSSPESSPEHPILVLDNKAGKLVHHSNGIFTNPIRRTAFEFKPLSLKERRGLSARISWK